MSNINAKRIAIVVLCILVLAAIITPIAYFATKNDKKKQGQSIGQPDQPNYQPISDNHEKIDCFPDISLPGEKVTKEECQKRYCVFDNSGAEEDAPICYFPKELGYVSLSHRNTSLGFEHTLKQKGKAPFGGDIENVLFQVEYLDDHVVRVKFTDTTHKRYEVPIPLNLPTSKAEHPVYEVVVTQKPLFAFEVVRKSNNRVIWDTSVGGLVLTEQFLQISTKLPSTNIYGFGENSHRSLRHDLNRTSWPMFAREEYTFSEGYKNLFGVHPFYTCSEGDGKSHGVLIWNSNAQEYSFTPLPMLTYRTIGGILDLYIFMGPEPESVIQQYTKVIGRPAIPPYWALGLQLSSNKYGNLDNMKALVKIWQDYNLPLDMLYAGLDHMDKNRDFTIDNVHFQALDYYFDTLRSKGVKTAILLTSGFDTKLYSPGYEPYEEIKKIGGSITWPKNYNAPDGSKDSTNAVLGYGWPTGKVVFPDFLKNKTRQLWSDLIGNHHKRLSFDGLWLEMNEPTNFGTNLQKPWNWPSDLEPWSLSCSQNRWDDPPYVTKAAYGYNTKERNGRLSDKTLCMTTRQGDEEEYSHYDVHNLYGWSQAQATRKSLQKATGHRGVVISRSTFPSSGKVGGHLLNVNTSHWSHLHASVISMLEFNMFGIPYVGANMCGLEGNADEEICIRWLQLGAFYPILRYHTDIESIFHVSTPVNGRIIQAARDAFTTRYRLLPYLYTLFHKANTIGGTVIRPLHHEFPEDENSHSIDRQFLWGSALLISPILESTSSHSFYLPTGVWYEFHSGACIQGPTTQHISVNYDTPIPLYVRGGYILPMQLSAKNTELSRLEPMSLLVALDDKEEAFGQLFWDDGRSIGTFENGRYYISKFQANKHSLRMRIERKRSRSADDLYLNSVTVYGLKDDVNFVYLDETNDFLAFSYNDSLKVLHITDFNVSLTRDFRIIWGKGDKEEEFSKIDCNPESIGGITVLSEADCLRRNCNYSLSTIPEVPRCYFQKELGYSVTSKSEKETGFVYELRKHGIGSPFGGDIIDVRFEVLFLSENVLNFKLYDPSSNRYEVPIEKNVPDTKPVKTRYDVIVTDETNFAFQIVRKSTKTVLFDTGVGGLVFADQFIQIATRLPSGNIYGLGENFHESFRHKLFYKSWSMFARDQPSTADRSSKGENLYGVHPFYTVMEDDGNSHGVLILNSNAQEYSFSPSPMLTYRTIGGILDFYMFLGPEPENVVQQYTQMIGRPFMPPYWSLGFQLSRYGYTSLDHMKQAVERTRAAGIPQDVQYGDIDIMQDYLDFTINQEKFGELPEYFTSLRKEGIRTILILDPPFMQDDDYEPYRKLKTVSGAIKWPAHNFSIPDGAGGYNGDLLASVRPVKKVVFPDFFKQATKEVWIELVENFHKNLTFDGLWIDMNEPANFGTNEEKPFNWPPDKAPWSLKCDNNTQDNPPYQTMAVYIYDKQSPENRIKLSDKTVCMVARQGDNGTYSHYDVHSLYGYTQAVATKEAVQRATGGRGVVISRSTYPGSGKYTGHWLGDNSSIWKDMKVSIIGILEFGLFGIPYIGADMCGYFYNTTEELCKRWMQLGAFYTFSRNHNRKVNMDQDPGYLGEDVARESREALEMRYQLLPYLYTLFHHAHTRGNTVIRPLHHEFPRDKVTYGIDEQFLWGPALLVSPFLEEDQESIKLYLPEGCWYNFYNGELVQNEGNVYITENVYPDSDIPVHIRGGYILPMQHPANNTMYSRENPFILYVALCSHSRRGGEAFGELFWDDGVGIDTFENGQYYFSRFSAKDNTFTMTVEHNGTPTLMQNATIDEIHVFGVDMFVSHVYVEEQQYETFTYNKDTKFPAKALLSTYSASHLQMTFTEGNFDAATLSCWIAASNFSSVDLKLKVLILRNLTMSMEREFIIEWRSSRHPTDEEKLRIECIPEGYNEQSETLCHKRNCIWAYSDETTGVPHCYINSSAYGYVVKSTGRNGDVQTAHLQLESPPIIGNGINEIQVDVHEFGDNQLRIKIFDPNNTRYEVPIPVNLDSSKGIGSSYIVEMTNETDSTFHLVVKRKSTNTIIFDTSIGGLTFTDQFLQFVTKVPSKNVYGFGEQRHFRLRHKFEYEAWPFFARDQPPGAGDYGNLYGSHPYYLCVEDDEGHAHSVLLLNSNAMEIQLIPAPAITYRTVGGILDFYIFIGQNSDDVTRQYTNAIGLPYLPPYWALGFQLCKYGYNSLENLQAAVNRTLEADIPLDVQYADIDHMDERMDFTIDNVNFNGLNEYFQTLRDNGMSTIIILDPALISNVSDYRPYHIGLERNVYIKWPEGKSPDFDEYNNTNMLGFVWPKGKVVFPDFFNPATHQFWKDMIVEHHVNLTFDGLWIDMNEPANFDTNKEKPWNWPDDAKPYWNLKCPTSDLDDPPYKPRAVWGPRLSDKTLCMVGLQTNGSLTYNHYDVHNLYGWSQTEPTLDGLRMATNKRGMVISRSTFVSSGRHAGHWLGDNGSEWKQLYDSIIGLIEFNWFGIPYIGADICGFFGESNAELCERWMQLGAFYTFSRNHNGFGNQPQDPAAFGPEVAASSRDVLNIRYMLLPYLYTLFYEVHTEGGSVINSLLSQFPQDKRTWNIDSQFMWGPAFMITPALHKNQREVDVYFPEALWFDFHTREKVTNESGTVTVDAPRDIIPLFIKGGHILPTQTPANNTRYSRLNYFALIVALDSAGQARGKLFWDDGDSIDTIKNNAYFHSEFIVSQSGLNSTLSMKINFSNAIVNGLMIDSMEIFPVITKPSIIDNNGQRHNNYTYIQQTKVLRLKNLQLDLSRSFYITWS